LIPIWLNRVCVPHSTETLSAELVERASLALPERAT
jgi:hypothetical protein